MAKQVSVLSSTHVLPTESMLRKSYLEMLQVSRKGGFCEDLGDPGVPRPLFCETRVMPLSLTASHYMFRS